MKEIKFRIWDKKENEMYDWEKILHFDQETMCMMTILSEATNDNDWIWSQYTGLKDKNGKDIHEGDIVKISDHPFEGPMSVNGNYEVGYNDMMELCCGSWLLFRFKYYCEVIGNIYENPELLQ